jgi:hypothetical protein
LAITSEEAERLERAAPLRLKFASPLNDRGELWSDADPDYPPFFEALPDGWEQTRLGLINTQSGYPRPASQLSDGQFELVAVEHETGIEIILIGVATALLADAVKEFIKWAWRRWQEQRKRRSVLPATLVIEIPRIDSSASPLRLEVPPPVSDDELSRYLKIAGELHPAL